MRKPSQADDAEPFRTDTIVTKKSYPQGGIVSKLIQNCVDAAGESRPNFHSPARI